MKNTEKTPLELANDASDIALEELLSLTRLLEIEEMVAINSAAVKLAAASRLWGSENTKECYNIKSTFYENID
jgi:hypothetical protein